MKMKFRKLVVSMMVALSMCMLSACGHEEETLESVVETEATQDNGPFDHHGEDDREGRYEELSDLYDQYLEMDEDEQKEVQPKLDEMRQWFMDGYDEEIENAEQRVQSGNPEGVKDDMGDLREQIHDERDVVCDDEQVKDYDERIDDVIDQADALEESLASEEITTTEQTRETTTQETTTEATQEFDVDVETTTKVNSTQGEREQPKQTAAPQQPGKQPQVQPVTTQAPKVETTVKITEPPKQETTVQTTQPPVVETDPPVQEEKQPQWGSNGLIIQYVHGSDPSEVVGASRTYTFTLDDGSQRTISIPDNVGDQYNIFAYFSYDYDSWNAWDEYSDIMWSSEGTWLYQSEIPF